MDLVKLNPEQKKAVEHGNSPLLIVAGAGTGKTTVITEKIKHLILKKKVGPQNILALTFTEKSSQEMIERLDEAMPIGYEEPWLGTFHKICDSILKEETLEIGLDPGYKIITPVDQWILIKKNLFDLGLNYYKPLGNPSKFISAIITFFSRIQDEDINLKTLDSLVEKKTKKAKAKEDKEAVKKLEELVNAYRGYQNLKIKESVMDFGDLITKTLKLFRSRPSILKKYRDQFQYILVDEFQDTNYSQYQLVKILVEDDKKNNLTVVGDDDQSIYKFRGAAISNILDFKKDFPSSKEIVLTKNYRSVPKILSSAYDLIQNNNPDRLEVKLKIDKRLKSQSKKKPREDPIIVSTETGYNEIEFVVKKILELVAKEKYSYKDFAILARANSQLDGFVTEFKRFGLPYQRVGNRGLFDQEEVRTLLELMRVVVDPKESSTLFHFLHSEHFNLNPELIMNLLAESKKARKSMWEVVKSSSDKSLGDAVELIKRYQKISLKENISKMLHSFILETDHIKNLISEETVENKLKIQNINLLFEKIKRFESDSQKSSLVEFVEAVGLWQEAGDNPAQAVIEDIDTISLTTVHSAKGLEFPVVFVSGLIAGRFPSINRKDPIEFPDDLVHESLPEGNARLEEERRLFYVAMTRAKHYLYLTYATDYGGVRKRKPSGFLAETKLDRIDYQPESQRSLLTSAKGGVPKASYLNIENKIVLKHLSYSQIDTFLACPLKYKYRYILKVPAEPHHALSFGQTIHSTLHNFHRLEQQGKTPTEKELLDIYKANFIEVGYDSEKHKKERYSSGLKALKNYYKLFPSLFGKPKLLERSFKLKIAGIPLVGKIDRLDESEEGLEIIDYKTGETKDQKKVDKDRQLTIYGMAAKQALGMDVVKMSLFYIETGKKISTSRSEKDYLKETKYLESKTKEILESSFKPKPGYPFPCGFCEYKKICPFAARK